MPGRRDSPASVVDTTFTSAWARHDLNVERPLKSRLRRSLQASPPTHRAIHYFALSRFAGLILPMLPALSIARTVHA